MPASTYQEQVIDSWLSSHTLPHECPVCGSEQRRIDLNPPSSGSWRSTGSGSGGRFTTASTPAFTRVEITCLACASVRLFDAGIMGVA